VDKCMTAPSVAALLREAIGLHHQGNSGKAEGLCRTAIKREPDNFHGLILLAFMLIQRGRLEEPASVAALRGRRKRVAKLTGIMSIC
jgi:thioredoxin-like negative regulator of GroEL